MRNKNRKSTGNNKVYWGKNELATWREKITALRKVIA